MKSKYYHETALIGWLASPLLVTLECFVFAGLWNIVAAIMGSGADSDYSDSTLVLALILNVPLVWLFLITPWWRHFKAADLPDTWSKRLWPVLAPFGYYLTVWMAISICSRHEYSQFDGFGFVFLFLTAPYFIYNSFMLFGGVGLEFIFPVIQIGYALLVTATLISASYAKKNPAKLDQASRWLIATSLALCTAAGALHYDRTTKILSYDSGVERVSAEFSGRLSDYKPFKKDNLLIRLKEPPTLTFESGYPMLDGATAAYPVYGALVQELYRGLDEKKAEAYVRCSTTDLAYKRLIEGEADIFFGAQPSPQQKEMAASRGVALALTPIAKEAFVFIVNRSNPVESLTVKQIRDIYLKKINNWREVGGVDEKIIPFQRSQNSGSQTIMLAKVMNGQALPPPLREEYSSHMGGLIISVANYRNYSSAIGYSFRFFTTGMNPNQNIKILAIDGIEPTVENIRTGAYPFTVDVYAVTAGSNNENIPKLLDWLLSEQGQTLVEQSGYVRLGHL